MRQRFATGGRAMKIIPSILAALDLGLATGERSVAQDASALVIDRTPMADLICGTQDRQSLVRVEMARFNHGNHPAHGSELGNRVGGGLGRR